MSPWVGFDLDGTLAEHEIGSGINEIGPPIEEMCQLAINYARRGVDVRIVTARVCSAQMPSVRHQQHILVRLWCLEHLGFEPVVTAEKDFGMLHLYDDRARQVRANRGTVVRDLQGRDPLADWLIQLADVVAERKLGAVCERAMFAAGTDGHCEYHTIGLDDANALRGFVGELLMTMNAPDDWAMPGVESQPTPPEVAREAATLPLLHEEWDLAPPAEGDDECLYNPLRYTGDVDTQGRVWSSLTVTRLVEVAVAAGYRPSDVLNLVNERKRLSDVYAGRAMTALMAHALAQNGGSIDMRFIAERAWSMATTMMETKP